MCVCVIPFTSWSVHLLKCRALFGTEMFAPELGERVFVWHSNRYKVVLLQSLPQKDGVLVTIDKSITRTRDHEIGFGGFTFFVIFFFLCSQMC